MLKFVDNMFSKLSVLPHLSKFEKCNGDELDKVLISLKANLSPDFKNFLLHVLPKEEQAGYFMSPSEISFEMEEANPSYVIKDYGFITFANDSGPHVYAVDTSDEKIYQFYVGSIQEDETKDLVLDKYVETTKQSIIQSSPQYWSSPDEFCSWYANEFEE